nr:hypothetical protein [Stenotrophomonas geniculata]
MSGYQSGTVAQQPAREFEPISKRLNPRFGPDFQDCFQGRLGRRSPLPHPIVDRDPTRRVFTHRHTQRANHMKMRRGLDDGSRFNYARRDRPNLIGCGVHQPALSCDLGDGAIPSSIVSLFNPVIALLKDCIGASAMQRCRIFAQMKAWSTGKLRRCQLISLLCGLSRLVLKATVIDTGRDTGCGQVSIDGFTYHLANPFHFPST